MNRHDQIIAALQALIPGLEYSRETHFQWRAYLAKHPEETAVMGTPEQHEKHIALYNERLAVIKQTIEYLSGFQTVPVPCAVEVVGGTGTVIFPVKTTA